MSVVTTGVPLTVNAGAGDDTIAVGGQAGLNLIRGDLTINGQAGTDALVLNDQVNSGVHTYEVTATSVSRPELFGPATIFYDSVASLVLNPASTIFASINPSNTINVRSTAAGTAVIVADGPDDDAHQRVAILRPSRIDLRQIFQLVGQPIGRAAL